MQSINEVTYRVEYEVRGAISELIKYLLNHGIVKPWVARYLKMRTPELAHMAWTRIHERRCNRSAWEPPLLTALLDIVSTIEAYETRFGRRVRVWLRGDLWAQLLPAFPENWPLGERPADAC